MHAAMIGVLILAACGSSHATAPAQPAATRSVTTVTTSTAAPSTTSALSAPSSAATAVSIDNFAFSPAAVAVKTGASVTWTNNDGEPHTVSFDDGQARSPVLAAPNATFSHMFTHAGTFTYHCSIHAYMTGTVTVSDA